MTRFARDAIPRPRKRKLTPEDDLPDSLTSTFGEVTGMYCPFVRGHYPVHPEIPKCRLLTFTRARELDDPVYVTRQTDKTFRSFVSVDGKLFYSESWEKNKKYAEQAAAIVALHCLDVRKVEGSSPDQESEGKEAKKARLSDESGESVEIA